jgi:hypothetical protein
MIRRPVLLALALLAASCQAMPPAAPTVGPTTALPTVERTLTLRGFVFDTAFRPLAGARIEVVDGANAGLTAVADATGGVTLTGTFQEVTLFRATADQHESRIQPWHCSAVCGASGAYPWLGFYLNPSGPSVDIAGGYTLTIVADAACVDIPPERRVRTYRASVSPQPANGRLGVSAFDLIVTDDSMIGRYRGFTIGVAGTHLGFDMHGGESPVVVERIHTNESISFSGFAATTVAGSKPPLITADMDGWVEYLSPLGATFNCASTAHQIILRRL